MYQFINLIHDNGKKICINVNYIKFISEISDDFSIIETKYEIIKVKHNIEYINSLINQNIELQYSKIDTDLDNDLEIKFYCKDGYLHSFNFNELSKYINSCESLKDLRSEFKVIYNFEQEYLTLIFDKDTDINEKQLNRKTGTKQLLALDNVIAYHFYVSLSEWKSIRDQINKVK